MESIDIVKRIVKENTKKYGEIQKCCQMHKSFCRCSFETEIIKHLKEKCPIK